MENGSIVAQGLPEDLRKQGLLAAEGKVKAEESHGKAEGEKVDDGKAKEAEAKPAKKLADVEKKATYVIPLLLILHQLTMLPQRLRERFDICAVL
jgi:hypothetical protein